MELITSMAVKFTPCINMKLLEVARHMVLRKLQAIGPLHQGLHTVEGVGLLSELPSWQVYNRPEWQSPQVAATLPRSELDGLTN